ncbi:MAG: hypothetical protein OEN20_03905 [Gammaproteobacteria bacterium]|nr:hypothetical protein [Gammaproteobacteria bacterium]
MPIVTKSDFDGTDPSGALRVSADNLRAALNRLNSVAGDVENDA